MAVSDALAKLLEPIRSELARVEVELGALDAQRGALIEERRRLNAVLRAASGPNGKPGPKAKRERLPAADQLARVRQYLPRDTEFCAMDVFRAMKEAGEAISQSTSNRAVKEFHDNGEIRFVRTGTAGSRWYRVIGADDE